MSYSGNEGFEMEMACIQIRMMDCGFGTGLLCVGEKRILLASDREDIPPSDKLQFSCFFLLTPRISPQPQRQLQFQCFSRHSPMIANTNPQSTVTQALEAPDALAIALTEAGR